MFNIIHFLNYYYCGSKWKLNHRRQTVIGLSPYGHHPRTCLLKCIVTYTHTHTYCYIMCLHACECLSMNVHMRECVSKRQRGLSAGHWPHAYQFAVISLACLSSVRCQLSKGLLWACPLMRGCSHALESIQHS